MDILEIMQGLNAAGHTIVMVTHSPQDSLYTKRVVHLVDGLIVRDELVEKPAIAVSESSEIGASVRERMVWDVAGQIQERPTEVLETVLETLQRVQDRNSKHGAAGTIARWIDDDRAISALQELLSDNEWSIRAEVVRALAKKPAERIRGLLLKAADDPNPWVRFLAVAEIRFLDNSWLKQNLYDKIIGFTRDPDERIRATVIRILQQWQDDETAKRGILELCRDRDGRVRANAIEALLKLGITTEEATALKINLEDPHNRARANAAVVLFSFEQELSLQCLEQMARHPNNMMRLSAAWALGQCDHERMAGIILEVAQSEKDENVRRLLTKSLASINDRIAKRSGQAAAAQTFRKEVEELTVQSGQNSGHGAALPKES
jgi:HEAT repeat protein